MESYKQMKSTMKFLIGGNYLGCCVETTKEFKKVDNVGDVEEIIKMKKKSFEVWSPMIFMGR